MTGALPLSESAIASDSPSISVRSPRACRSMTFDKIQLRQLDARTGDCAGSRQPADSRLAA